MKNLLTSSLLTLAAVPFLMAAPNAAKKAQNTATPASQTQAATVKKTHKKHVKKNQSKPASDTVAPTSGAAKK